MNNRTGGINQKNRKKDTDVYTHPKVAKFIFEYLSPHLKTDKRKIYILDACSGENSVLGTYLQATLIEDSNLRFTQLFSNDIIYDKSILEYNPPIKFDFIICNPPWHPTKLAEQIYWHLISMLNETGVLIFIINNVFCYQGSSRAEKLLFQKYYFLPQYCFANNSGWFEIEEKDMPLNIKYLGKYQSEKNINKKYWLNNRCYLNKLNKKYYIYKSRNLLDCGIMVYHKSNELSKEAINLNCFIPFRKDIFDD